MERLLAKLLLAAALLSFSRIVPAQTLPQLPTDPSVQLGALGSGVQYYLVKDVSKAGYAQMTVVQQADPLTPAKRAALSSRFLSRMGVAPGPEGFLEEKDGATFYRFADVPVYRTEVLDSMLLLCFKQIAPVPSRQAIIVTGDIDPAEVQQKLTIFSLMVPRLPAATVPEPYSWKNRPAPRVQTYAGEDSWIEVSYESPRIPAAQMNTAQAIVTDLFGAEFQVLLRHRLERRLRSAGIPCADIRFSSLRSADHSGNEQYSVRLKVRPQDRDAALFELAQVLGSLDAAGVSPQEFVQAKEILYPLIAAGSSRSYTDRCVAHFLYGANLAPAQERLRLFARKNIAENQETRLYNNYASAMLGQLANLTLGYGGVDTLDVDQVLFDYNLGYLMGEVIRDTADYSWRPADTLGLEVSPARIRIMHEKADPVSGGTLWTFSNGVRVLFKPFPGSGMFNYSLVLNGGLSLIPDLQAGEGGHIASMLGLYDVAGLSAPDFRDLLEVNGITLDADVQLSAMTLSGSAPSGKLALLLKTFIGLAETRQANTDEFARYSQVQALQELSRDDLLYSQLNPGFRYSSRKGSLTPNTQRKAESYYADRFSRLNDGVLILSGDLEEGVVKRLLSRYLGAFPAIRGTVGRRAVEFRPKNGTVTVTGHDAPRGIYILMDGPGVMTSDNFYLSMAAARALRATLIRHLAPYGYTADVRTGYMTQPQERFRLFVTCRPLPAESLPADVAGASVGSALTAVRAAIAEASGCQASATDVDAWKSGIRAQIQGALSRQDGFVTTLSVRYAVNKDITTRYEESISAISPSRICSFMSALSSGGRVEYLVP